MTDTKEIILCPACHTKMQKIFLPEININIDVCADGCGGIFFDNRELKILNNNAEQVEAVIKSFENKTFMAVDLSAERICPACGAKMVKNKANREDITDDELIIIDECYQCGGKFLDYKELEAFKHKQADNFTGKTVPDIQYLVYQIGLFDENDIKKSTPLKNLLNKLLGC